MSVVGIDLGTQSTRIAVVRAGGVDVICNEVSDRMTPSMVSFDAKRRYAGDASRTQMLGNMRNTVAAVPRLVGRRACDVSAQERELSPCALVATGADETSAIGAAVSYCGEERVFGGVELAASFLNRMRMIAQSETGAPVSDVVIAVSSDWSERERCALRDAAEVAGLRVVRVVNATSAAATMYGITKTDIPAETPRIVAIVDVGHGSLDACLVAVAAGRAEVLAHAADAGVGGRNIDDALAQHWAADILAKKGVDVRASRKAMLRMRGTAERVKKVLSGIQTTRAELEALVDGQDFGVEMTRQQLEELAAPVFGRIADALRPLLAAVPPGRCVDAVEIIGGSTRIPAVKEMLARLFGVEAVSTTLNADEAVARGAAIVCAMESPTVRVREFRVVDVSTRAVRLVWRGPAGEQLAAVDAFPVGSRLGEARAIHAPSAVLPLTLEASYADGTPLALFSLSPGPKMDVPADAKNARIYVRACVDASGLADVLSATLEVDIVEAVPSDAEAEASEPAVRTITRAIPLKLKAERCFLLPRAEVARLRDAESAMAAADRLVAETDDARNAVEEAIYAVRGRIDDGAYDAVCSEDERSRARALLAAAEDWLYGDGAEADKAAYVAKLAEIQAAVRPWADRVAEIERAAAAEKAAAAKAAAEKAAPAQPAAVDVPAMDMD